MRPYYPVAFQISVDQGLLMRGSRLIIPSSLHQEMLGRIHEGHQGITKCRERARQSAWWSKMLEQLVRNCTECCKVQKQRHQPLILSPLPEVPWRQVARPQMEATYIPPDRRLLLSLRDITPEPDNCRCYHTYEKCLCKVHTVCACSVPPGFLGVWKLADTTA